MYLPDDYEKPPSMELWQPVTKLHFTSYVNPFQLCITWIHTFCPTSGQLIVEKHWICLRQEYKQDWCTNLEVSLKQPPPSSRLALAAELTLPSERHSLWSAGPAPRRSPQILLHQSSSAEDNVKMFMQWSTKTGNVKGRNK